MNTMHAPDPVPALDPPPALAFDLAAPYGLAAPEKQVEPNPVRLRLKLRLDKTKRVRGSADVSPFHASRCAKLPLMPPGKALGEFVPDGVDMRGENDDGI